MSIAAAIRAHVLTLSPVTSIVGTRVRLVKTLQSEPVFPVLRIQRISQSVVVGHMRGFGPVKRARIQIDAIAMEGSGIDVYERATALDRAVEGPGDGTGLLGFSGDIGSPSVRIHVIQGDGVREGYDPAELKQFKVMHDYLVDFSE